MTEIASALLDWFDQNRRSFPFRETKVPYRIWISEIMLQQTRTETVTPYYERFLRAFPDVFALADAREADVLKAWEGLGYYTRARNLKKTADIVAHSLNGVFPNTVAGLLSLPGIGDYTAGAIASIAYDLPIPAMDGNLTRVFARLYDLHENTSRPETKERLYALAQQHMPDTRSGDVNQALMDLGAGVCKPIPHCDACPLASLCLAKAHGTQDALPVKDQKKPPVSISYDVLLVEHDGRLLMLKRKEKMLNGLWVFPLLPGENTGDAIAAALSPLNLQAEPKRLKEGVHVFTHQVWHMRVWHAAADSFAIPAAFKGSQWMTPAEILEAPKPTAMRLALACASRLIGR
ncbi:MAG: A/G-specific adenine glycosylase [Clostridia bacterium]|nr:A/G-specific adenine glycosylase [Clostridia bacterium]